MNKNVLTSINLYQDSPWKGSFKRSST